MFLWYTISAFNLYDHLNGAFRGVSTHVLKRLHNMTDIIVMNKDKDNTLYNCL